MTRQVKLTAGTQEQSFQLAQDPLRLEELVTTGVSEATSTKKLTFSVGKASEAQLQVAPGVTALGALQGKVAGVSMIDANGMPGTAPQIKLRGATSISGNQKSALLCLDDDLKDETIEVLKGFSDKQLIVAKLALDTTKKFELHNSFKDNLWVV